jgi:hypothetical protein
MKKILLIAALPFLLVLASCKKDLTSLNVDPKNPQVAPSGAFYSSAQKNLVDALTSTNVNDNIFRLIMQYWQETTYTDESNYDIITRENPKQLWNYLYRDVIRDIREAKRLMESDVSNENVRKNQMAIAEVTEIMAWYYLVTTFGDIPYTEAMQVNSITLPKYDKQQDVYNDLLTRLDAAIASLDASNESFGSADILYGGDITAWKRFANSFKLKMGMTIADADNEKAKATVESAVQGGLITSNEENAQFNYLSSPPNTNPIWVDLVQSNRKDFVAASTIVDRMKALGDPRIPLYFTFDQNGDYSGGKPGSSSAYSNFSKPADAIIAPDFPAVFMDYSEVEFLLAEAVERGYNVGGSAKEHYDKAVTASVEYWGGTPAEAAAYLAKPGVAYSSANWKQLIGEQKWIALYNRGWDAWIEWRRLDYPNIVAPETAETDVPLRFTYPIP